MKKNFLKFIIIYLLYFYQCNFVGLCSSNKIDKPAKFPSLNSCLDIKKTLYFCGEKVPIDEHDVKERLEKEMLITVSNRTQVILWLKRSNRYFPFIKRMLKKHNMPQDLIYIPIIESALRPHAGSSKGAIGFWQFMKSTGLKYDLIINTDIDERRNIFSSTNAAIKYFKELHDIFGSWTLAAAAYNMGEEGLEAEMLAQKQDNYYKLYLSLETQRYIFKAICAKLVLSSPEKYGFNLNKKDLYEPLQFERLRLMCNQETPIWIIAQSAKTYFKIIKDLNPEIRGHYFAKGMHSFLVPKGSSAGFHKRYFNVLKQYLSKNNETIYVVQKGDNLSSIARRFDVPLPAILIWNKLSLRKHIHPGDRLIIHKTGK